MKILLGVSGGIAAYKAAELTRELQRRGASVQVVMTDAAERFITPLTFASLSGQQVLTSLWQPATSDSASHDPAAFDIEHIAIAQQIGALVIAPATANILAKLAHGMADDLLTTIALATKAPVFVAPAMNVNMWHHAATRANVATLRSRGVHVIGPGTGDLACGMVGEGRLAEPTQIADAVSHALADHAEHAPHMDLAGETFLITAGGTREPIDPVRYLGNRSSGRMGFALAEAAVARGAEVILITAAVAPAHLRCETICATTAAEMRNAILAALPRASTVIMAAAISDYRIAEPAQQKLKKSDDTATRTLELTQNDDILLQIVAARRPGTLVVGFAAETEALLAEGRRKLREKNLDAIIANDVSHPDSGFEVDRNAGFFLSHGVEAVLPSSTKRVMADRIFDHLVSIRAYGAVSTTA